MWPLERKHDLVRIGRDRVEHWSREGRQFALRGQRPIECGSPPSPEGLAAALRPLLEDMRAIQGKAAAAVDVVLESTWLPVLLLDTGDPLWSRSRTEALLQHRLAQLHGRPGAADGWELQLQHDAAGAQVLGYGLAPSVRQAVVEAAAAAGQPLASLQPALAWAWRRLKRHRPGRSRREPGGAWWLWVEQDRCLVTHLAGGRVMVLNAGAPLPGDDPQCAELVRIEGVRQGLPPTEKARIGVADWCAPCGDPPLSRRPARVTRLSLATAEAFSPASQPSGANERVPA